MRMVTKRKEQYGILSLVFMPEDSSSNDERKVIVYRVKWHLVIFFVFLQELTKTVKKATTNRGLR